MRRVVITGMGALTPIGNDVATFWGNLVAGVLGQLQNLTHQNLKQLLLVN